MRSARSGLTEVVALRGEVVVEVDDAAMQEEERHSAAAQAIARVRIVRRNRCTLE